MANMTAAVEGAAAAAAPLAEASGELEIGSVRHARSKASAAAEWRAVSGRLPPGTVKVLRTKESIDERVAPTV